MLRDRMFESFVGLVSVLVFGIFGFFVFSIYSKTANSGFSYYKLIAKFNDIDGISIGSPVKISGFEVGKVEKIYIDENFAAVIELTMRSTIKIPDDSSLSISTSGLIGSKYLLVSTGSSDEFLKPGSAFSFTQSSINIDSLIKKFAVGAK